MDKDGGEGWRRIGRKERDEKGGDWREANGQKKWERKERGIKMRERKKEKSRKESNGKEGKT